MLIAARSSHDFACCSRATASARSKYAFALAASGSGDIQYDIPRDAINLGLNHPLFRCSYRRHGFINGLGSLIELADVYVGARQT